MTTPQRDTLLYSVLLRMYHIDNKEARYELQRIGESLIGEYRDMDYLDTTKKLNAIKEKYNV